ncbi:MULTISPECIES: ABC transporter ATP-binding protein [Herbaspirillum]|jgi:amino acid/amide ABC transporter ATP-binding protein 2, HAAT family (TC 3.A.1.4.-)|uniref:ABC transporter ATP-binding protein n=1 Tax=Herbaspirillum TaxID=963 RepID=UPI000400071A|nr:MULTISPECIES: ABC transporter ATP-binding protein [Herbaspirillum]MBP1316792.1 branched-chain amino acid transport system ATP-binding protein [Herbaspirillum sp. 1130]MCP3657609.1 ABC transporter ATP-binding protein [Herbaspirillum sp.]MCP3949781.1 ABC transporter ATP-binding protein [Herbaspirillum sp.]MCP4035032.1 ABC transporter ATP-binding protein [Herbaspirillum sp.]MCP4556511.1 ABC transporter ATP-binding protein [Herbaspirillum sp.]
MSALLEVEGLTGGYGASQVLFGIDMQVREGEVVTLLGRNGMGKTTTLRTILGLNRPTGGVVRFRGEAIHSASADAIARRGIAIVPEGRQIFKNLSVEENLSAFAARRNGRDNPWTLEKIYQQFPRLKERRHNGGGQLSGGEQQMLAIGRALMTNPHLLILDEATEGLAPLVREEIWACLKALREYGLTIIVIDKYIKRLIGFADQHTILEKGKVVWQGDSAQLSVQTELWDQYLSV